MKTDSVVLLAEKMVQMLRSLRRQGEASYPLTLKHLGELSGADAEPKTILSAASPRRKAFSQHAVVARADLQAPVALLEDLPRLAACGMLLEYLLGISRTPTNQAASVPELAKKVTSKLQKPFQDAVNRQIEEETLPRSVGWLLVKRSKKLFLLQDLHVGGGQRESATLAPAETAKVESPVRPRDDTSEFAQAFDDAFQRLDRQHGAHNFVSLVELRRAVPGTRESFDAELRQLRLAGRYSLSAAEGRHGLSPEEREAAVLEDGTLLLYVSKKAL
jgi:hypothetical protein